MNASTVKARRSTRTFITASNMPFLLGYFGSPDERDSFWYSKGQERRKFVANKNMDWGIKNEHKGINAILNEYPHLTIEPSEFKLLDTGVMAGKIGADPDGILYKDGAPIGVAEVKCKSQYTGSQFDLSIKAYTEIPSYYYPQFQMEMEVYNLDQGIFCCWTLGDVTFFEVKRDDEYIQRLIALFKTLEDWYDSRSEQVRGVEKLLEEFRTFTEIQVHKYQPVK